MISRSLSTDEANVGAGTTAEATAAAPAAVGAGISRTGGRAGVGATFAKVGRMTGRIPEPAAGTATVVLGTVATEEARVTMGTGVELVRPRPAEGAAVGGVATIVEGGGILSIKVPTAAWPSIIPGVVSMKEDKSEEVGTGGVAGVLVLGTSRIASAANSAISLVAAW